MTDTKYIDATQAEKGWTKEEQERALVWRKIGALEAMARDHQGRSELLTEAAKALRSKHGLPETD